MPADLRGVARRHLRGGQGDLSVPLRPAGVHRGHMRARDKHWEERRRSGEPSLLLRSTWCSRNVFPNPKSGRSVSVVTVRAGAEPPPFSSPRGTSARTEEAVATTGRPAPPLAHSRVDGIPRNRWATSVGIGGRRAAESADDRRAERPRPAVVICRTTLSRHSRPLPSLMRRARRSVAVTTISRPYP